MKQQNFSGNILKKTKNIPKENKEQLTYEILSRTNNLDSVMAKHCSGKGNILPSLGTKCYIVT